MIKGSGRCYVAVAVHNFAAIHNFLLLVPRRSDRAGGRGYNRPPRRFVWRFGYNSGFRRKLWSGYTSPLADPVRSSVVAVLGFDQRKTTGEFCLLTGPDI